MLFLFWSGLGSGLAFFSLGSGSVGLLLGGFVSGFLCFFLVFFPLFYSLVRGGLGVLDHGAGLMVCLFFFSSYTLHFTVGHTELCTFCV